MNTIEQQYNINIVTTSDINEHLETLYKYACECDVVAEFGVRDAFSSYALAHARPKKLICVDIFTNKHIEMLVDQCKREGVNIQFDQANTLNYVLEEVDMLFIDTVHSFTQITAELELHHSKVKKYLIFHDTISFGNCNEDDRQCGSGCGLVPAIKNFLRNNPKWKEVMTYTNNNGLSILKYEE